MKTKKWTKEEVDDLYELYANGMTLAEVAQQFDVSYQSAHDIVKKVRHQQDWYDNLPSSKEYRRKSCVKRVVSESPMQRYDTPLEQTGDCLILPDTEFPYHHADFLNRCLDLAMTLGVKQACIAGDVLHFDSISKWEANWKGDSVNGMSDKAHSRLIDLLPDLPTNAQNLLLQVMEEFEVREENDIGNEIRISRKILNDISQYFDDIVYVIGNHDGRFLSALNSPMFADQLKQFVIGDNPKYRIAPFYYSILHTEAGDYRITHPVSAAQNTAISLASQFHQHIIMGHSHNYNRAYDPSGKYWAIQTGCCVDETRLAYAAQRDRGAKRHALGAVLVYHGFPFDLSLNTPWDLMKKM